MGSGPDPPREGAFSFGDGRPIVKCGDTLQSSVQKRLNGLISRLWTLVGPRKHKFSRIRGANEPSVCFGDAALCQITLTTCYYRMRRLTPPRCDASFAERGTDSH